MSSPLLSICIPTHNFGPFISDTLRSVIGQATPEVEIVVLDSASTDETRQTVLSHRSQNIGLHYHYQDRKGGIDADMARVVELATGEYCWLLSADDAVSANALPRMLQELRSRHDIYLCNRLWCSKDLAPLHVDSWLRYGTDKTFNLSDCAELTDYLESAVSIGALFSCMSTITVRRAGWLSVSDGLRLQGTNYAHVYRLFSLARRIGTKVKYIADPLIMCRSDNDSFASGGIVERYLLDMRGYDVHAEALFASEPKLKSSFRRVVLRQHRWYVWVWLSSLAINPAQRSEIQRMLTCYGYPPWLRVSTSLLGKSRIGLGAARRIDRVLQTLGGK